MLFFTIYNEISTISGFIQHRKTISNTTVQVKSIVYKSTSTISALQCHMALDFMDLAMAETSGIFICVLA